MVCETADKDQEVVDWVLRMARVPPDDFLDVVAADGGLTPALLDALGDAVAAYHGAVAMAPCPDPSPLRGRGSPAPTLSRGAGEGWGGGNPAMRHVIDGNAQSALDAGLPEATVEAWKPNSSTASTASPLAGAARSRWFVRRVHGDLHLGNLCLWRGEPVPFDALEFDEAMATIDLGYDLAFLLMDLDQRVDRAAANRVLNRYVARTGDARLTRGLPVFLSLRAMVRAHVEAKRGNNAPAERYLDAATAHLRVVPPIALAVGGLPGSGKSTVARALAPELGNAPGACSAAMRSANARTGLRPSSASRSPPIATPRARPCSPSLPNLVRQTAAGWHAVIADATFIILRTARQFIAAAAAWGVVSLDCGSGAVIGPHQRISSRQGDASDATLAVLAPRLGAIRRPATGFRSMPAGRRTARRPGASGAPTARDTQLT